ncbi:MAG: hypothetical protein Q4G68_14935 [Planctomycetia bacterium]|nr:hypothetical protein [Planctomycetia bacterium]
MTTRLFLLGAALVMLCLASPDAAMSQAPGKQYLASPALPTGELAELANVAQARTQQAYYFQPVQFRVPDGVTVAVAQPGGYSAEQRSTQAGQEGGSWPCFGMLPGRVYRLKIGNIPLRAGQELYPTLELLGRLTPPAGREFDFPVQVDIEREDLDLALSGHLVTRVVYLEAPLLAMPTDSSLASGRVAFDVPDGLNPLAVAESKGTVMAVLRMGSRVADEVPNYDSSFFFGLPEFTVRP